MPLPKDSYEVMVQSAWDRVGQTWRPVAAWVYREGEEIHVVPVAGFEGEAQRMDEALTEGRARDFPEDVMWAYWTDYTGHYYDHLSDPIKVDAPGWQLAAGQVLGHLLQPGN